MLLLVFFEILDIITALEQEVLLIVYAIEVVYLFTLFRCQFNQLLRGRRIEVYIRTAEHSDVVVPVVQSVATFPHNSDAASLVKYVLSFVVLEFGFVSGSSMRSYEYVNNI